MTLRLVLVSLVAALGFTIPGTPVIERWVASTQDWMNARFADWDTRNLPSTDGVIASDHNAERLLGRQASRLSEAVITPEVLSRPVKNTQSLVENTHSPLLPPVKFVPKCSVFESLEIGEKPARDIAFRLDPRNSRGRAASLEGPPASLASRVKFDAASAVGTSARQCTASLDTWAASIARSLRSLSFAVASHPRTEHGPRLKTSMIELAAELRSKTQEPGIKLEEAAVGRRHASAPESFGAMEQNESLYFATDLPQVSEGLGITPPALKDCRPVMAFVADVCSIAAPARAVVDDVYEEMTGCLRPFDDGFARPVAKPAAERQAPAVAPGTQNVARKSEEVTGIAHRRAIKPRFEPLEVGEYHRTVIVFDLNRRCDGSQSASVPADATVAPVPTVLSMPTTKAESVSTRLAPDLSRAVKLTREAVYAWVNVLAGPAIVTVAQPNSNRIE